MKDNPSRQDNDDIKELLIQYQHLKAGRSSRFLDEESFEKIIDHYDETEELPQALEAAEIGSSQFPYSSTLQLKKADLLIASRRYQDALEILERAEILDSGDINLYILKTDAYLALDLQEKAVELLENALAHFNGDERIDLLFELADVYDDYEEFDKVFDCLKMILEQEPQNEEALYKICFWTDFTGRNAESIQLHQQIIDDYPYSELAWFNLAAAFQGLKLYEKAIDAYKYAIVIDEKFDYAYRNMGDALIRLRKYRDAIEVLEKVLELSRPEDVIFEAIGFCYDKIKNYAQARFYYRKASHLNQSDSKLLYKIALTYMQEEQWQQAVKQLDAAMNIVVSHSDYHLALGKCKMELGEIKEAIHHFSAVVSAKPKNTMGWESLIQCLYKAAYFTEAREQVLAALLHTEGKALFVYYHSAVCFALGKSKEGLLLLEKALYKSPKLLKKFVDLHPVILQNQQVVDLIARFRREKNK
jgi:tetratricopeptide (TPR) repeat protein